MQKHKSTVHLLIMDPSQNDAESLVSLLRNSGRATRAHRVTSAEDLDDAIKTSPWDLFLARDADTEQAFRPEDALATIRRLDKDIPFILLGNDTGDGDRTVRFLKAGAQDVVPFDQSERLTLTVWRELAALDERRRRRVLESHLREAEQRCQLLLESSRDAIAYINDGMHIYANRTYMEFLGYDDIDDLICVPVLDTLASASQGPYRQFVKEFADTRKDGMSLNCTARRSDDRELDITMTVSSATYDGEACIQIVVQPKQSGNTGELEEKIKEISSQDLLTGLYNRHHMMDLLARAVVTAGEKNADGAFAYIAVDGFVGLKTDIGITGIDLLLGDLANLLKQTLGDDITLARLSDDAFGLLAQPCTETRMLEQCQALRRAVADHLFEIQGRTAQVSLSIGVAAITENSPKAPDMLGRAHMASADARKQGVDGSGVVLYNPVAFEKLDDSNSLEAIQKALDEDRFKLLFQPIINLRGEGEEHYEALVRMLNNDGEEVSPYDFLPPMGPSDMATRIDRWVTLQTIKQLSNHRSRGHDTRLFVNVTAETIQDRTFTAWLSVALKAARLPGNSLIFQMREGDANSYMKQAREFSRSLHELHCQSAISQFGCALNPFNTLKHVDVKYVKVDGSFTEEIQKSEEARERIREMIQSLQSSGRLTIIPLVENATVLATLWQAGVNYIQGYYLQAPVPEMNYDFGDQ